jgi:cell division septation protein DedD
VKSNANALAAKLKAKGFDTYMVKVGTLYKVQVGAFGVKANADAMMKKLKASGFEAFITTESGTAVTIESVPVKKSVTEIAKEVINGKWGNGVDRKNRLVAAGYNYSEIQTMVNKLLK